jgi:hypothetical protein
MDRITVERIYSASVSDVFQVALEVVVSLGHVVVHADENAHTIVFEATSGSSFVEFFTVFVVGAQSVTHVVINTHSRTNALARRNQLVGWSTRRGVADRFLDALTRALSAPPAGWFADPSRRFVQRWWDGRAWTQWARDDPHGVRFEDTLEPEHAPPA